MRSVCYARRSWLSADPPTLALTSSKSKNKITNRVLNWIKQKSNWPPNKWLSLINKESSKSLVVTDDVLFLGQKDFLQLVWKPRLS